MGSQAGWSFWGLSLAGFGCAILIIVETFATMTAWHLAVFLLIGLGVATSTVAFASHELRTYRVALSLRILAFLGLVPLLGDDQDALLILSLGLLIEIGIHQPYPRSIGLGATILVVQAVLQGWSSGLTTLQNWNSMLLSLVVGGPTLMLATLFSRYYEANIQLQEDRDRLDTMVVEMSRANLIYQDSAKEASESATQSERLRITRDIHDIVGYTLTNNIAMMEAATDMMRRNPLGIPSFLRAARDNAQDGLKQIRAELYKLRDQEDAGPPQGLRALNRLCRLFERATRIEVLFAYGNTKWRYGDPTDFAVYHLIQEALLNAFRHGRATKARVSLWETEESLQVNIEDNGQGADDFREGIGIRGMRERLTPLGGTLIIQPTKGAFLVHASIPFPGGHHV